MEKIVSMIGNLCLSLYKLLIAFLVFFICFLIIGPGFRYHVAAPFICLVPASFIFYSLNVKKGKCANANTQHAAKHAEDQKRKNEFTNSNGRR